jgi:hypothetical protein
MIASQDSEVIAVGSMEDSHVVSGCDINDGLKDHYVLQHIKERKCVSQGLVYKKYMTQ